MRYALAALAAVALMVAVGPGLATEKYVCTNRGKSYPVFLDRDTKSLNINGEKADVEHMEWASQTVGVRGTVDLGNVFFWAELNNEPSIEWMRNQKITRIDRCRFSEKPET